MASDAERALAAKAAEQDGLFTITDARAFELSERRIRHRSQHVWRRIYDGIYPMPGRDHVSALDANGRAGPDRSRKPSHP